MSIAVLFPVITFSSTINKSELKNSTIVFNSIEVFLLSFTLLSERIISFKIQPLFLSIILQES